MVNNKIPTEIPNLNLPINWNIRKPEPFRPRAVNIP